MSRPSSWLRVPLLLGAVRHTLPLSRLRTSSPQPALPRAPPSSPWSPSTSAMPLSLPRTARQCALCSRTLTSTRPSTLTWTVPLSRVRPSRLVPSLLMLLVATLCSQKPLQPSLSAKMSRRPRLLLEHWRFFAARSAPSGNTPSTEPSSCPPSSSSSSPPWLPAPSSHPPPTRTRGHCSAVPTTSSGLRVTCSTSLSRNSRLGGRRTVPRSTLVIFRRAKARCMRRMSPPLGLALPSSVWMPRLHSRPLV
mmetsp:Transcript_7489/g.17142  ORF Transcript_7489/g.17142 Transcript_7489/m.17142 type:complete len:250 (-) Transcript_7489:2313-3062(-)